MYQFTKEVRVNLRFRLVIKPFEKFIEVSGLYELIFSSEKVFFKSINGLKLKPK